jgi:hypothetical protein
MTRPGRLALVVLFLLPLSSSPAPRPQALIASQLDDGTPALAPVNARQGQRVTLYAVLRVGRRYHSDAPALLLGGRRLPPGRLKPLRELGAAVTWFQVEPEPHHLRLPPPNPGNPAYSNAVLFGRTHGRWLGYDRIEYNERSIPGESSSSLTLLRVRPSHPRVNVHGGLGTMRFKVLIRVGGETHASPGMEATGKQGILPSVMRVSFRESDDLAGWMTGYFNVPNVFGSGGDGATHQTELFQGADCADVITGAARLACTHSRSCPRMAYTSVLGLRRFARPVSAVLLLDRSGVYAIDGAGHRGQPVQLSFGSDVRRGDIMLIDYVGFDGSPRSWDHVGVVARDRGRPGIFDPGDTVLHMGYLYGLLEAEAHTEGPARIQLMRFRPELLPRAVTGVARHP